MTEQPSSNLPLIFLIAEPMEGMVLPADYHALAVNSDGVILAGHVSSSRSWASRDLHSPMKLSIYSRSCPNGYTLIDLTALTIEQLLFHPQFASVYAKLNTPSPEDSSHAPSERSEVGPPGEASA